MPQYVAFLRAVNVAGHASVKMSDLRDVFAAAGAQNVTTYIQSGNVMFETSSRAASVVVSNAKRSLAVMLGEPSTIMVRSMRRLVKLLEDSPFENRETRAPVKHYVAFLSRKPRRVPPLPLISEREALELFALDGCDALLVSRQKKNGFFGFPNNFVESELGVSATSRNWSTVTKLVTKASSM